MSKCVVVGVTMFSASLAAAASAMEVKDVRVVFLGDFAGGFGVRVENAGEFHLAGGGEFGINAGVMLAERAGAEDGDFILTFAMREVCQHWMETEIRNVTRRTRRLRR